MRWTVIFHVSRISFASLSEYIRTSGFVVYDNGRVNPSLSLGVFSIIKVIILSRNIREMLNVRIQSRSRIGETKLTKPAGPIRDYYAAHAMKNYNIKS